MQKLWTVPFLFHENSKEEFDHDSNLRPSVGFDRAEGGAQALRCTIAACPRPRRLESNATRSRRGEICGECGLQDNGHASMGFVRKSSHMRFAEDGTVLAAPATTYESLVTIAVETHVLCRTTIGRRDRLHREGNVGPGRSLRAPRSWTRVPPVRPSSRAFGAAEGGRTAWGTDPAMPPPT